MYRSKHRLAFLRLAGCCGMLTVASAAFQALINYFRKPVPFDVLTSTLGDITRLLDEGQLTSVDLVRAYVSQITNHNHAGTKLHALVSVVQDDIALDVARRLDKERRKGQIRSRLHGIPFVAKDTMWSEASLGVPTTCGTFALRNTLAKENADVIQLFIDAGMILIGKANLSELGGAKSSKCIAGCSASGGQTQSAYVMGGIAPGDSWLGHSNPAGSSAGSAVAVSAGMAPMALGTEADGSLVMPSDRAALYSIRLSPDAISRRGVLPYNGLSDSLGPMTKSPEDAAHVLNILLGRNDLTQFLGRSFAGMNIGFLDPTEWASGPAAVKPNESFAKQYISEFDAAVGKIEAAGATVTRKVKLRRITAEDDNMCSSIAWHDYGPGFADFTAGMINPPVRTLSELVEFNKKHHEEAMPEGCEGQDCIEEAVAKMNATTDEVYKECRRKVIHNNRVLGLDQTFAEYGLDVIIGAPTGRSVTVYDLAGYPVGTMPLGYARFNERPFGVAVVAPRRREDVIIGIMSAWEGLFGPRKPPRQLVQWSGKMQGGGLQMSPV
ncbi:amidase signature domain-containing protein [Apodospora peruviana]|uniref:Amidase signature domain-containing protein n=1 Tax=Apodospora peruviana TaxID=516989 RepID=A0AAE0IUM6_9PEZI|nr:amidase signature domain-containing protein [Apodospora peruviana]